MKTTMLVPLIHDKAIKSIVVILKSNHERRYLTRSRFVV